MVNTKYINMHNYNNTVGIIIFYNNNSLKTNIKVGIKTMEILHFFVIFYDFVMKCVYKSTIYTFVIQKCTCYFCVLGPENTPLPHTCPALLCKPPPPVYTLKILHYISKLNFVAHGVKFGVLKLICTYGPEAPQL